MADMRIMIDTNIILDVLAHRRPHFTDSSHIWVKVESGDIEGFISAHTISNIYYLSRQRRSIQATNDIIRDILQVFGVAAINNDVLKQALSLRWDDYEGALQAASAAYCQCHYLVSRKHAIGNSPVDIISPANFLLL